MVQGLPVLAQPVVLQRLPGCQPQRGVPLQASLQARGNNMVVRSESVQHVSLLGGLVWLGMQSAANNPHSIFTLRKSRNSQSPLAPRAASRVFVLGRRTRPRELAGTGSGACVTAERGGRAVWSAAISSCTCN